MNVTPFGAKSPTETVVGVSADANGNLNTKKVWNNEVIKICDVSTPTSSGGYCDNVDLSNAGAVSLRVRNSTDQDITLVLYVDFVSSHYRMKDATGADIAIVIPANTLNVMITPDDIPQLQWINKLSLGYLPDADATSGSIVIYAVIKR